MTPATASGSGLTLPTRTEAEYRAQRDRGVDLSAPFNADKFFKDIPADEWTPTIEPPKARTLGSILLTGVCIVVCSVLVMAMVSGLVDFYEYVRSAMP